VRRPPSPGASRPRAIREHDTTASDEHSRRAGRVTDPLRPLPFAFAKRHGVLVRGLSDDRADVVLRAGATPFAWPRCAATCAARS
jgi:hypothetical protein